MQNIVKHGGWYVLKKKRSNNIRLGSLTERNITRDADALTTNQLHLSCIGVGGGAVKNKGSANPIEAKHTVGETVQLMTYDFNEERAFTSLV